MEEKKNLFTFHKVDLPLLWLFNTVGYCRCLVPTCFANDFAFRNYSPDISCYNNYFYSLYKGANAKDDFVIPDWNVYDITMRYFLYYLETDEEYKYQKRIAIPKKNQYQYC